MNTYTGTNSSDIVLGSNVDDLMRAYRGDDTVYGFSGHDSIIGSAGHDTLYGGNGDDRITDDSGLDVIYGGDGEDWIRSYLDDDKDFGGAGQDIIYTGAGRDYANGNEDMDVIYGGVDDDELRGGKGNDTLYGGRSHGDWLRGDRGDDTISGTGTLEGSDGIDVLIHGGDGARADGESRLYGGNDDDYLFFNDGYAVAEGGQGADTYVLRTFYDQDEETWDGDLPQYLQIEDFERGEDVLNLTMNDGHADLLGEFGDTNYDGIYGEGDRGLTVYSDGILIEVEQAFGTDYPHGAGVFLVGIPELEIGVDLIIG